MFVSLYVRDMSLLYFTVKLRRTVQSVNTLLLVSRLFLFTYFNDLQSRRPRSMFLHPIE